MLVICSATSMSAITRSRSGTNGFDAVRRLAHHHLSRHCRRLMTFFDTVDGFDLQTTKVR